MRVTLQHSIDKLTAQVDAQVLRKVDAITARSLNRVATTVRKTAAQTIRERYNVKQRDVTSEIKIYRAQRGRLVAMVTASGAPLSLRKFGGRVKTISTTKGPRQAVTVKILNAQGRKVYTGAFSPGSGRKSALLTKGPVFVRSSRTNNKLFAQNARRVAAMFREKKTLAASRAVIGPRFKVEFERELAFEVAKLKKFIA